MKKRIIQIVLVLLALVAAVIGARYWQNNYRFPIFPFTLHGYMRYPKAH